MATEDVLKNVKTQLGSSTAHVFQAINCLQITTRVKVGLLLNVTTLLVRFISVQFNHLELIYNIKNTLFDT